MTREKIIQGLQFTIEMCLFDPMTGAKRPKEVLNDLDKTTVDSCEGAIKLLEQEPFINKPCVSEKVCEHDKQMVLDKIRAEIEQNAYPIVHGVNNHEKGMTLYGILQIIDKYKAESEDKE